ncbi:twin-arginine translocation pathway protein, TatA/TatE family [Syntrophotalea carbinolica DSM 2380]|uniref:Sec-independent protein translocase protein TatA n=1 Tax=Syntrophotalea carbinolica (strain DSM 2380 / NBRC 103641 / GraBd1) TaxID=338963 RepID=Q0C6F3_SYNC1|nr:twin-arginine translocase TatA/TatE family subunit [Syntrophotalea carbinolica]ABI81985.1 twin-arginine translocation pathway protein, TatA/TatE family [Syntrophotalea carbinolica DSM 2380]
MPGFWELVLLLIICLLLFGARRLPEIGASLGKGLSNFQHSLRGNKDKDSPDDSNPPQDKH